MKRLGFWMAAAILAAAFFTSQPANANSDCQVATIQDLNICLTKNSTPQTIFFTSDISCEDRGCCPSAKIQDSQGVKIDGGGHTFRRSLSGASCSAISVSNSSSIEITRLTIDESPSKSPCKPADGCANSIEISNSTDIRITGVGVYSPRAIGISVGGTQDLLLSDSIVSDAGIIGVFVGRSSRRTSRDVKILRNTIVKSRTNGLVFQGVESTDGSKNSVQANLFDSNHHFGLYLDPQGRPHNGGQIYIPDANQVDIRDNLISNGFCETCNNKAVWSIELGPIGVLSGISVRTNTFVNSFGMAVFSNRETKYAEPAEISGNTVKWISEISNLKQEWLHENLSSNPERDNAKPGAAEYAIYRIKQLDGLHAESGYRVSPESSVESVFYLSDHLRPDGAPIYRCQVRGSSSNDFPSTSRFCEGQGLPLELLGFSHEATTPNVSPIFRCLRTKADDRFVSWDPGCEGEKSEGKLGYGLRARKVASPP